MNLLTKIVASLITFPAILKGMKLGRNSFLGPGYDFLFVSFKGIELGNNVLIGKNAWIQTTPSKKNGQRLIFIDDGTQIGRNTTISATKKIQIGKKCLVSYNVSILDNDHDFTKTNVSPMDLGTIKGKPIIIGEHCFIGAHSFILKGVHLGKHCVVGANSVVTKSFPDYSYIAGNPAYLIKKRK